MARLRIALGALSLLLLGAALVSAQPPMPPPTELIVTDAAGNEVLRLAPDQMTTQLQMLRAGKYHLTITGPGDFGLLLKDDSEIELKRRGPGRPDQGPHGLGMPSMPVEDQPVVIDFDGAPGDQGMRRTEAAGPGEEVALQLTAKGLPPFYGWSAVIEFDPDQLVLVSNSFRPSGFVPGLVPLVDTREGRIEVGGANFTKMQVEGDGELAGLAFETLEGFTGHAELHLTEVKLRGVDGTQVINVPAMAIITGPGVPLAGPVGPRSGSGYESQGPQDVPPLAGKLQNPMAADAQAIERSRSPRNPPPDAPPLAPAVRNPPPDAPPPAPAVLSGQAAVEALLNDNACPGCDLSNANLMQQDLEEADLSGAILTGANLFRAKLKRANLSGADLSRANVLQTNLREADLTQANLTDARLTGAKMEGANLEEAIMDGAKIQGANFTKATWIDGSECGRGSVGRCRHKKGSGM